MKAFAKKFRFAALVSTLLFAGTLWAAPDGVIKLPNFDALSNKASKSVNITLDSSLLGIAANFLDGSKPDEAAVKELVAGLKGIYVRSFTFDADFPYPQAEVDRLRAQLSAPAWQRIVEVRDRKDQGDVDVYICLDRSRASGLTIIASKPREFTVVNIVGSIDLQRLHQLEGKFGIPKMQVEEDRKKK